MARQLPQFAWIAAVVAILGGVQWCSAQGGTSDRRKAWTHTKGPPTDGPEWTQFSASPDTRIVYVSSASGDDALSGLSPAQAKKTLAAGYELIRDGFPDWLLLKRGDTWSEPIPNWNKSGRGASEPVLVGSYGAGTRPRLNTGSGAGFFASGYPEPRAHLAVTDLHLYCDRIGGAPTEAGLTILNLWSDVLVENCKIELYPNNIVMQDGGIGRPSDIRIRRCVIADAYRPDGAHSAGIFAGGVDGLLIEECVFDHNGWRRGVPGANANIFNHNMYLHEASTGVVTRGNITARASATGILQRSGGTCENNLLLLNPVGIFLGISEVAGPAVHNALRNNVVLDARDIDSQTPRGFGIWLGGTERTEVYGNIVAHQRTGSNNINAFNLESTLRSVAIYRNIVYDWTGESGVNGVAVSLHMTHALGVQIVDNQFQQTRGGFLVELVGQSAGDLGPVFGNNRYFTLNSPPNEFYFGLDYSQWVQASGEPWLSFGQTGFHDPNRTIETYMMSLGLAPSLDQFMARARLQERTSWDTRFTAAAVNNYVQQGFGVSARGCRADFNDDGLVNILDLIVFQTAFSNADPHTDLNLDGAFNAQDFAIFQNNLAAGCP